MTDNTFEEVMDAWKKPPDDDSVLTDTVDAWHSKKPAAEHGAEQPNPAQYYVDLVKKFAAGGIHKAAGWPDNFISRTLQNPDNIAALGALRLSPVYKSLQDAKFNLINDTGKNVGDMRVEYNPTSRDLNVLGMTSYKSSPYPAGSAALQGNPLAGSLGHADIRSVVKALQGEFPEAQTLTAGRISGSRTGPAGTGAAAVKIPLRQQQAPEIIRNQDIYRVMPPGTEAAHAFRPGSAGEGVYAFTDAEAAREYQKALGGNIYQAKIDPYTPHYLDDFSIEGLRNVRHGKGSPPVYANAGDSELYPRGHQIHVVDTNLIDPTTAQEFKWLPEKIQAAATRYQGKIYTGNVHYQSLEAAADDHGLSVSQFIDTVNKAAGKTEATHDLEGFITSNGRFVSREEARQIADRADQLTGRARIEGDPLLSMEELRVDERPGFGKPSQK